MAAVIGSALPGEITEEYEVKETLGTGHFSTVKLGVNRSPPPINPRLRPPPRAPPHI